MKDMLVRTVLAFVVLMVAALPAMAQRHCRLQFTMLNSTRHVIGEVNTECGPFHSPPFGNWGVESNFGGRTNSFQFAGWKWIDSLLQWNSCTRDHIRDTEILSREP